MTSRSADKERNQFILQLIQHQDRLRGFVRCLLFDSKCVDDVLQETNRVLLQKMEAFELGSDFWAWACQVARFEVLAQFKRQQRDKHVFNMELLEDLAARAESHLRQQPVRKLALDACLQELSSTQKQLLQWRYALGQSMQEIAQRLQRPVGSLRQSLHRIRLSLRQCVKQKMREETA